MSRITPELMRHVAELSRLELSDEELTTFTRQLDAVLAHVAQLEELDLDGEALEGTAHAVDLTCPFRADEPGPSLPRDRVLEPAPERDEACFVVPRVIEG